MPFGDITKEVQKPLEAAALLCVFSTSKLDDLFAKPALQKMQSSLDK